MEELIGKYLANECNQEEWLQVESYAQKQPEEFAQHRELWESLSTYSYNVPKMDFNTIKQRIGEEKPRRKLLLKPFYRVAAAVLLLLSMSYIAFQFYPALGQEYAEVIEVQATNQVIQLVDGSEVVARKGAVVKILSDFGDETRGVELEGTAFFRVAKDKDKPFIIKSEVGIVQVLGTEFEVGKDLVSVKSGRVMVEKGKQVLFLEKGEQAVLDKNGMLTENNLANYENEWAWVDKQFVFRNASLSKVIVDLEEAYQVSIEYNKSLANLKFTGKFQGQSLEEVLEVLESSLGVKLTAH